MALAALVVVVLVVALPAAAQPEVSGAGDEAVHVELYHSDACPHCRAERAFLADLVTDHPEVTVSAYELTSSPENRARLAEGAADLGVDASSVPITIIDGEVWVGFGTTTAAAIEARVTAALAAADLPAEADADVAMGPPALPEDDVVDVPFLGQVDAGQQSLVVATALIGFLDGVNPCSLWVLSLLLALVVHTGSRRRVLAVGAVFLVVTTSMYGLMMAGVYGVLSVVAYLTWVRVGVAALAGAMGTVNVLDAAGVDLPVRLRIPEGRKPGIYRRMRAAARSEGSLVASLAATAALAMGVSLVETPCSAGFPVVWSNLLAGADVSGLAVGGLFGLYMLVFLLDELVVFTVAVTTLRAWKLQERQGMWLKLGGGMVMLALAATMLLAPQLLESIVGTLAVFAGAAAVTAVTGTWLRRRGRQPLRRGRPRGPRRPRGVARRDRSAVRAGAPR